MKNRKLFKYRGRVCFMIKNNFNGTVDIAEGDTVNQFGEHCWVGCERAVEKDELEEIK